MCACVCDRTPFAGYVKWDWLSYSNAVFFTAVAVRGSGDSGVTQVAAGAAHHAAVFHAGAEVRGLPAAGLPGGERLHGGEDERQAVGNVLIWGTGQSWRVSCRGLIGE